MHLKQDYRLSLERKNIRKQLALHVYNKTAAANRVYVNRSHDTNPVFPYITIECIGDQVVSERDSYRDLHRQLGVEIRCYTAGSSDEEAADRLDELSEQVEQLIARNRFLEDGSGVNHASNVSLISTEIVQENGDRPVHISLIQLQIDYFTLWPKPYEAVDDLAGVSTEYDHKPATEPKPKLEGTIDY